MLGARSQNDRSGADRLRSPASITTRQSGEAAAASAWTAGRKLRLPPRTQTARRPPKSGMVLASSTRCVGLAARSSPSRRASENGSLGSSTDARISFSARSRTRPTSGPNTRTMGCAGLGRAMKASICAALRATILRDHVHDSLWNHDHLLGRLSVQRPLDRLKGQYGGLDLRILGIAINRDVGAFFA